MEKRLLETIKIENGEIFNLSYHQERLDRSRKALFSLENKLALAPLLEAPKNGLYRCRIIYGHKIDSIEYIPYTPKKIRCLKIVTSAIDYSYKYEERKELELLLSDEKNCDEVLIEKNGYLTDTTVANIAFYDKGTWFTPKQPLLKGTMRQKLIDEGFLKTKEIKKEDLMQFSKVALMNAMIGFKIIKSITIEQ